MNKKYPSARQVFRMAYGKGGLPPSLAKGKVVAYGIVRKKPPRLCYAIARTDVADSPLFTIYFLEWNPDKIVEYTQYGRSYGSEERCHAWALQLQTKI